MITKTICLTAILSFALSGAQNLSLTVGEGVVLDYPGDVVRVLTSSPEVVDPVAVTSREILFNAKGPGLATIVVWLKSGERIVRSVNVNANLESIRRLMKDTFPNEAIDVRSARDALSLIGRVSSQAVADRAVALATPLSKSVVSNLDVIPPKGEKQI
nr:pilus assembly protein N-terminal domain-containing protein [Acidobacteriota bacterium]